ncbi:hypothetical protein D6833_05180 [Candidatus Parcubacteria bacterium]|nr:MAG: hypothetical protein D6833_05180 [Candidatus Parcubacteria bacterium]
MARCTIVGSNSSGNNAIWVGGTLRLLGSIITVGNASSGLANGVWIDGGSATLIGNSISGGSGVNYSDVGLINGASAVLRANSLTAGTSSNPPKIVDNEYGTSNRLEMYDNFLDPGSYNGNIYGVYNNGILTSYRNSISGTSRAGGTFFPWFTYGDARIVSVEDVEYDSLSNFAENSFRNNSLSRFVGGHLMDRLVSNDRADFRIIHSRLDDWAYISSNNQSRFWLVGNAIDTRTIVGNWTNVINPGTYAVLIANTIRGYGGVVNSGWLAASNNSLFSTDTAINLQNASTTYLLNNYFGSKIGYSLVHGLSNAGLAHYYNNDFWGLTSRGLYGYCYNGSSYTWQLCPVGVTNMGWFWASAGSGNFAENPGLVDAESGDFHPTTGSLLIDHGVDPSPNVNGYLGGLYTPYLYRDIDGNPRPHDDSIDIGAYEWQGP